MAAQQRLLSESYVGRVLERGPVLVNSDILTVNYRIKQSQFTKSTLEPRASDPEESNEVFDCAI